MRLILSVDALAPTLTGIGRYTLELASRFQQLDAFRQLRFFRAGRWVRDPASLLQVRATTAGSGMNYPAWAKRLYWQTTCRWNIFHAPNYFLPPFARNGIVSVHDLSVLKFPQSHPAERVRQFESNFEKSLGIAAHLITDTSTVRREVIDQYGWPEDRITAVPLGVSPSYHPRTADDNAAALATHGLVHGGYTLCVCTMEPRKRVEALLDAYGRLPQRLRTTFPLILVGSTGWRSEALHAAIRQSEEAGWLRYLGFVAEQDLPCLYAGAALFAYPSIYEGFGLPVAEALASAVPVITSNRSCLPEVAGGAAMLIDPDDSDDFCRSLEQGLTDPAWRDAARRRGPEVAAAYTWDACVDGTLEVYRRVAAAGLA